MSPQTPDPRTDVQILDRDYVPGELEETEQWIIPIFEPVRLTYLMKPFPLQICLPENALPADADVAYMIGLHPELGGTWKEIFVFRSLRIVQIYNVMSHGRRFYRYDSMPSPSISDCLVQVSRVHNGCALFAERDATFLR